ncbi:MAG TPA: ribonuclease E/G, partial [Nitrosomonas sp.]|nr:ribonuclease E/G [Nitrosomonas sp.]
DRGKLRSRRGRNNRNERNKDNLAANKGAAQNGTVDISMSTNALSIDTEQSPQHAATAERKPSKNKSIQKVDSNLTEKTQTEDLSLAEKEDAEGASPKSDNRRRLRRHRGNKNRDQSTRDKGVAENQEMTAEESLSSIAQRDDYSVSIEESPIGATKIEEHAEPIVADENPATVTPRRHSARKVVANTTEDNPPLTAHSDQPATVVAAPPAAETTPIKELPDFKKSGLVMIETPPEKVDMVMEDIIVPKRPRRRTKEIVATETEPLMQVETRE